MPSRWLSKRSSAQVWGKRPGQLEDIAKGPLAFVASGAHRVGADSGAWDEEDRAMVDGLKSRLARAAAGVAALALAFGLGGCSLATPSLDEAVDETPAQAIADSELVQAGTLTVALDTSDAPQVITGTDGELVGYDIDVATALAENMGLKVSFVNATSPSSALEGGEADIYLGATASDESGDISTEGEVLQNATAIFGINTGSTSAASTTVSASDLTSARVGVQDGSASQEALARVNVVASSTYSNVNECFEALAAGEVDYVACDATAGGYLARSYEGVFFAGTISSSTSYGIAYLSSSSDLADEVNNALDALATDGTLDAIHQAWYGPVPLSLSSEVISGVTLSTDESASDDESASSDGEPTITEDINSLD